MKWPQFFIAGKRATSPLVFVLVFFSRWLATAPCYENISVSINRM